MGKCCPHNIKSWPCFSMLCTRCVKEFRNGAAQSISMSCPRGLSQWGMRRFDLVPLSIFFTCKCAEWLAWNHLHVVAMKYESPKGERVHLSHQQSGIVPPKGALTLQVGPVHFSIGHGGDYVLGQQPDEERPCQVKPDGFFPLLRHTIKAEKKRLELSGVVEVSWDKQDQTCHAVCEQIPAKSVLYL